MHEALGSQLAQKHHQTAAVPDLTQKGRAKKVVVDLSDTVSGHHSTSSQTDGA